MKKKLIYAFSFCLLTLSSFAQKDKEPAVELTKDFTYSVSKPYEVVDGRRKEYFGKNGEVLSAKFHGKTCILQKFEGASLNEVKRKEYEDFPDGFVEEDIIEMDNHYYVYYSVWDKPNKTEQLFVREIDFDKCEFVDKGSRIISVNGKITGGFAVKEGYSRGVSFSGMTFGEEPKFSFERSYDDSKLLITYRRVPEKKSDKANFDVIGMYAYDSEMNKISGQDVKMPYTEAKMNNVAYTIGSDGDIYILTEVFKVDQNKRFEKDGTPNFKVELMTIDKGKTEATAVDVNIPGKIINQISFFEGPKGELYVAGYYANEKKSAGYKTDGMFYFTLSTDGSLSKSTDVEIPLEVMQQYLSERTQKKMEKNEEDGDDMSLTNMVLRQLLVNEDGSVVFVGEKHYSVTRYDSKGNAQTTYYYKNMLIAKLGKDGELEWMNQLPKSQSGGMPRGGMGYKYIPSGNSHYLMFLDNARNISLALNEIPKNHSDGLGGYLTGFKVDDETGEIKRVSILDTRNAKGIALHQFATTRMVEINPNQFALECYKKDKEDVMINIKVVE